MKNGALYDHLQDRNNVEKRRSLLNSWKMGIKISLDAARGIQYLHNYAEPPVIHGHINSCNILLDANWVAGVSDFGLSFVGPEFAEKDGYDDPECFGRNLLTTETDVYGFGVVLLELLTGKRPILDGRNYRGAPRKLVDDAIPAIKAGKLAKLLDERVGTPEVNEAEAVELVAYAAMQCVNLGGRRPTITFVAGLGRALMLYGE